MPTALSVKRLRNESSKRDSCNQSSIEYISRNLQIVVSIENQERFSKSASHRFLSLSLPRRRSHFPFSIWQRQRQELSNFRFGEQEQGNQSFCQTISNMTIRQKFCVILTVTKREEEDGEEAACLTRSLSTRAVWGFMAGNPSMIYHCNFAYSFANFCSFQMRHANPTRMSRASHSCRREEEKRRDWWRRVAAARVTQFGQ